MCVGLLLHIKNSASSIKNYKIYAHINVYPYYYKNHV